MRRVWESSQQAFLRVAGRHDAKMASWYHEALLARTLSSRCSLYIIRNFFAVNGSLRLESDIHMALFQTENHITGTFKKADIAFPAHAALAVLQADELLLHLTSAAGTELIVFTHSICREFPPSLSPRRGVFRRWNPARFSALPAWLWRPRWPFWPPV